MSTATRRNISHIAAAAACRAQPGMWLPVGEYRNRGSAEDVARRIRAGTPLGDQRYGTPYTPTGQFDARTCLTDDGTLLEARYTPEGRPAVSFPTRTPMTDTQRVLGQIERGEVRAGAEAARQIAARHQAAYGNDVWGPCPDTAWADAITDLTTQNSRKDVRP